MKVSFKSTDLLTKQSNDAVLTDFMKLSLRSTNLLQKQINDTIITDLMKLDAKWHWMIGLKICDFSMQLKSIAS